MYRDDEADPKFRALEGSTTYLRAGQRVVGVRVNWQPE